jgi:hypothetical protein
VESFVYGGCSALRNWIFTHFTRPLLLCLQNMCIKVHWNKQVCVPSVNLPSLRKRVLLALHTTSYFMRTNQLLKLGKQRHLLGTNKREGSKHKMPHAKFRERHTQFHKHLRCCLIHVFFFEKVFPSETLTAWHHLSAEVDTKLADKRRSLCRCSSLADRGHGV